MSSPPLDRRAAWAWRAYALLQRHAQHDVGRDDDLVCRIAARRLMGRPGVARPGRTTASVRSALPAATAVSVPGQRVPS